MCAMSVRSFVILVAVTAFSVGGCSKPDPKLPKLVPVSGIVTLDGKPLEGASVTFRPVGSTPGSGAFGACGPDGRYELKSARTQEVGTAVGEYRVTINKLSDDAPVSGDRPAATDETTIDLLPARYSSYDGTELKASVPPDGGKFDFDLKSK